MTFSRSKKPPAANSADFRWMNSDPVDEASDRTGIASGNLDWNLTGDEISLPVSAPLGFIDQSADFAEHSQGFVEGLFVPILARDCNKFL